MKVEDILYLITISMSNITQWNWGFEDPYKNQEYLNSMKSKVEGLKDKTDEELIQLLNENSDNNWLYGKYIRYAELDQQSKRHPNLRKHGDHKRDQIKDNYNQAWNYLQNNRDPESKTWARVLEWDYWSEDEAKGESDEE